MSCLAEQEISLVEGVRTSLLLCAGFSCYEAQPLCAQASVACGLSSCDLLAPSYLGFSSCPHRLISCDSHSGPRVCLAVALRLSVPQYVESSQTRERSCVPRIGRWILIHCTTGKVPSLPFFSNQFTLPILLESLCQSQIHFSSLPSFALSFPSSLPSRPPFFSLFLPFLLLCFLLLIIPTPSSFLFFVSACWSTELLSRAASVKSFRRPFVALL